MTEDHSETKQNSASMGILLVVIKTGKCDICKATKKILILRYGFSLCEDCLNVCTDILEKLQIQTTKQGLKNQFKEVKKQQPTITMQETKPSGKIKSPKAKTWDD
jgi:hypothetical protein